MAKAQVPPGPRGNFLFGNFLDFSRDPLGFLSLCAKEYPDVALMRVGRLNSYILNNPDHIEEVLVAKSRYFRKDRFLNLRLFRLLLGNGLLTSDGDFWRRQRRLAQPAFHRDRIANYARVMVDYTERMLESWRDGDERDIHHSFMELTLEIVAKTLFDADVRGKAGEVGEALEVAMDRFASQGSIVRMLDNFLPTPGRIRYQRAVRRLEEIIYRFIGEHRQSGRDAGDLLSMLLAARDEDGSQMSDRQLRDEVMTIFLAGHETTALALSWTFYLLALNPGTERKLMAELDQLSGKAPGISDLGRLSYTERVIKEAMRLYPPAWSIGREAIEECEIGGYNLPPGTQVYMIQWTMHRNPRYFEDPEEFRPERWTEDFEKRLPRFAYFPFGGGPRLCIGNSFAIMEAVLILATIAQRFKLTLAPAQTITPWPSVTLRPKTGIRMRLDRR
jgi:cytochrome P450